ncbi:MAG: hypothetical protein IPJ86_15335 [Bacteroidetes bacterium]|nr:hypothetical protein [Bacteroidota bacterium]
MNETAFNTSDTSIKIVNQAVSADTAITYQKISQDTVHKKITKIKNKTPIAHIRYAEAPTNVNFNGKPMTQQLDLASKILQLYPDTLIHLAKASYSGYDHLFPVSIMDNFEKGISKQKIHYPKLTFEFQLFENEYKLKPYLIKLISIKKEGDGTLTAE